MYWVGIDVGGTFTDVVVYNEQTGQLDVTKTASTPSEAAQGILNGLAKLDVPLHAAKRITHGMTLATNAVLEGKGVRVGLLTTQGYRDVLELRRGNRTVLYNMRFRPPAPLVPRRLVHEVGERMQADGSVLRPLDIAEVRRAAEKLQAQGVEAVAVCFLHAYVNDAHEQAAAEVLHDTLPGVFVSTSAAVLPEFREYERFSTTVLNAYVGPVIDGYLQHLEEALQDRGYDAGLSIVNSSGGIMSAAHARRFPVNSMLSGPAAGVAAAAYLGRLAGYPNIITYDMGGTSTDVCLIEHGQPTMTAEREIAGYPNKTLQIDINTIGAGGGSIAWLDEGKVLNVGPQSAGAMPGPVCYDQGGEQLTVTDANVALQRIDCEQPLGGEIQLRRDRVDAALRAMAEALPGMEVHRLAHGLIQLAVTKMTGAIKEISIVRGRDPRDFVLFAYGGAGPMHATQVADELGMHTIVIPLAPGNFSALGMLVSDVRRDYVRTQVVRLDEAQLSDMTEIFAQLEAEGTAEMVQQGMAPADIRHQRVLGMRYTGQSFEIGVPWQDFGDVAEIAETFYDIHEERYHHSLRKPCEVVNFRLSTFGLVPKPVLSAPDTPQHGLAAAITQHRPVYFAAGMQQTPVYQRDALPRQTPFAGPALIEEAGALTVITPGYVAHVDDHGNIILQRQEVFADRSH